MGDLYLQRPEADGNRVAVEAPAVTTATGESQVGQAAELGGTGPVTATPTTGQATELSPAGPEEAVAAASPPAPEAAAPSAGGTAYTVARGDTLSGISRAHYGRPDLWRGIYQANESVIGHNPNIIHPNQQLVLPTLETIITTCNHRDTVQAAFEARWSVSVGREVGAARIPVDTFRRVHAELLRLPTAHVQGTWTRLLHLNNSSGAYMSSGGEFGLGEDAATTGDQEFGTAAMSLTDDAATGATVIKLDATSLVGPGVSLTIGDGDTAEVVSITAVNADRTEFTIDPALQNDHVFGETVAVTNNQARNVVWLEAVVRHEIGHAVDTAVGVTGFTEGLGGWQSTKDIDTWASWMGNAWATNDASVITDDEKRQIKDVIGGLTTSPTTAGLNDGLDASHPINTYWTKGVPIIEAAKPMALGGSDYWQNSGAYYGTGGKFFTINDYYEEFHAFNDVVQYNQVRSYQTYSPAEFFAEIYTVYYEEAGQENPQLGRLVPVQEWATWITDHIHNHGHAPVAEGAVE